MKKIYLLLISICLVAFNLNAQKWVSTTPQNKNVVLEEFTGIHCGYCPDGHKRANELQEANPGRVVLINVHAGGYANPTGSEPDFRTTEGTAIDGSAGVTGYPAGSINRYKTPWAESRGNWSTTAADILSQPSPVNIAVKASVDFATRTLTTEVEVYYTSTPAQTTNKLTVGLIQDKILGPQSDYGNFNPDYWYNGQYMHMHAFRQMISSGGAFGENLDTTTAGHYTYRKYVTVLPSTIKNIPLYLYNLKVYAFVAATNSNIYTGVEVPVDFDPNLKTDLGLTDLTTPPTGLLYTTVNPKVEVTNNMDQTITSFDVTATIDGIANKKSFTGTLAKGQKTIIDWGQLAVTAVGTYTIGLSGFENVNGGTLYDMDFKNDIASISAMRFATKAFSTINGGFNGTIPLNFALDNQKPNTKFSNYNSSSPTYGANGTTGAVLFYLDASWNVAGQNEEIIFGEADFTTLTKPLLSLYYAYSDGSKGGTAPIIKIQVSEDGGANWAWINTIYPVQTGQPSNPNNIYIPTSAQYQWIGTSLAKYKNKSVMLKITVVPGSGGNGLWIDEIAITQGNGISDQASGQFNYSVFPNPVNDFANISFTLDKKSDVSFELFNTLGQKLISTETSSYNAGSNSLSINTSALEQGTYVGVLKINGQSVTTKFVK
jgi:hypothetical protein